MLLHCISSVLGRLVSLLIGMNESRFNQYQRSTQKQQAASTLASPELDSLAHEQAIQGHVSIQPDGTP